MDLILRFDIWIRETVYRPISDRLTAGKLINAHLAWWCFGFNLLFSFLAVYLSYVSIKDLRSYSVIGNALCAIVYLGTSNGSRSSYSWSMGPMALVSLVLRLICLILIVAAPISYLNGTAGIWKTIANMGGYGALLSALYFSELDSAPPSERKKPKGVLARI